MKILHLIYDDMDNPWVGGGGALRVYEISKRLSQKHEITIITGNYPGAKVKEKNGVLYKRIGTPKSYFLSRLTYGLNTWKYIRGATYDLIVDEFSAHSPCFAPLPTKKPVIASLQNLYGEHALKSHNLLGLLFIFFEKFGLRLYKNFISVSPSIKEQLENKILKDKDIRNVVIPNGVDEYLFSGEFSEKNYILFLGRIDIYQKGLDILLSAFEKVVKKVKDIKLVIAGGGKDEEKLKGLIDKSNVKDRIKYIGRVADKKKKKELLSGPLFLCMPSRFESFGMVALEASAVGISVIATRVGGISEVVKHGKTGILTKPEDVQSLFKAMLNLIEDKNLRKRLGENAKQWARKFSWDKIAKKQEDFYYKCLK